MTIDYAQRLVGDERVITTGDGTKISAVSMGSGTPVVLAHGYAVDRDCWNVVADDLVRRGYRVIAFDQRGHGRSTIGTEGVGSRQMVNDYLAVLREYDVRNGVLVGHSMGGFLAIRALVEHSNAMAQHLRGCLLMATFAGDVNRKNLQNRVQIPLIQLGVMGRLVRNRSIARGFAKTLLGDVKDPGMIEAFIDVFSQADLTSLVPILRAFVKESRYPQLRTVTLPCTIVVGTADKTTPPFHTDDLHAGIKGSKLVRVPGKGHMLNWEAPDVLVEEIVALAG
ncbi:MAG: alpha/beta fold hydrolase, partial [Ilumatobacteraceae bacterium]